MLAAMIWRIAAAAACLALIAACATSYPTAPGATPSPISTRPTSPPAETPSELPTVPPFPTGPSAEIEVLVSGGDFDGSYRAVAAGACESKPTLNTFTVAYANDFAADGFTVLNLVLRDAALAQSDASPDFLAEIGLAGAGGGVTYSLDPADGRGEGEAYLDVSPFDATLDLSAAAPDGTLIDLTVICELI
jgi:hypothetical protein